MTDGVLAYALIPAAALLLDTLWVIPVRNASGGIDRPVDFFPGKPAVSGGI